MEGRPDRGGARAGVRDEIAGWRRELAAIYGGSADNRRRDRRCSRSSREFGLPRPQFEALIDGVEMDLDHARYPDVRGVVRVLPSRRIGSWTDLPRDLRLSRSAARDYADSLGMALQLTNIIRDVAVDLRRGRVYLPAEHLARFGVTVDALAAGRVTPAVRELLRFECGEARDVLRPRGAATASRRPPQPGRGGNHGRDLFRDPAPDRALRIRRLQPPHPRAATASRRDRPACLAARPGVALIEPG